MKRYIYTHILKQLQKWKFHSHSSFAPYKWSYNTIESIRFSTAFKIKKKRRNDNLFHVSLPNTFSPPTPASYTRHNARMLYAMFTADRELEAGFSLKFQPVKRLARIAAMISPEDRERLMCRWRGIEAAAVCEVYNLIRVPHGRPQNTECSSRGRDRPLLRPHIAALIIRLYRITLAYHRRAMYESIRSVSLSLSLCQTQRTFWSRGWLSS